LREFLWGSGIFKILPIEKFPQNSRKIPDLANLRSLALQTISRIFSRNPSKKKKQYGGGR